MWICSNAITVQRASRNHQHHGKKLKNPVVNVVAALPLSNEDGAAISRTENNNRSNNRRGKEDTK
jgi:hypothetical protein